MNHGLNHTAPGHKPARKRGAFGPGALLGIGLCLAANAPLRADTDKHILDVPDYRWYAGCFGTANGNLFGYWDRNGFPNFYTGPTAGGIAPLNDFNANVGIRSMWASKAGTDGRPLDKPGHIDDYWDVYSSDFNYSYESTQEDRYKRLGRAEHAPDCIGDFIGLSQKKWVNMDGECDGNIDAYSFVYWDGTGARRTNWSPPSDAGLPAVDIQSGLRAWTRHCGYEADVFTQLADFNPETPPGTGFTFEDVKREIDLGYPVMVFLQPYGQFFRAMSGMPKANPDIHGVLIFGYAEDEFGPLVRIRTSWASGSSFAQWQEWSAYPWLNLPGHSVRGVIGYRPKPKITDIRREGGQITLTWDGPSSAVSDNIKGTTRKVHEYVLEHSRTLNPPAFVAVTSPTTDLTQTVAECCDGAGYYRVKLLEP